MKKFFTKKRVIILISVIVAVALITTIIAVAVTKVKNKPQEDSGYIEATARKGSITKTIEASGVIEPNDRYEITALAKGEIIYAPFEEGDFVNEDDVLYKIDDEDAQINIEKANNGIEKAQISQNNTLEDISKLNIYAPTSGVLGSLKLKETAQIASGEVATITNTDELKVKIPFLASEFDNITVGNSVTLTSAMYMTSLEGYVSYKFAANESTAQDGSSVRNVEITIPNPGALGIGTTVSASVHTSGGDICSASSGTIESGAVTSVISDVGGTVKTLNVKEGDYVTKGQLIAVLENESLMNEKRNNEINMVDNELSLRSSIKNLENYTITSPISGTVITKTSKAGDKIDNSNSQTIMMVVADMSCVKFVISVDELDISDIQIGQTAIVDADAISGKTFDGVVSSIAAEGISTGDGVTTYDVEITIAEPGELKSGMNVNANIVVAEANDVITIPEEALTGSDGLAAKVLVKSSDSNSGDVKKDRPQNIMPDGERQSGGMPNVNAPEGDAASVEMPNANVSEGDAARVETQNGNTKNAQTTKDGVSDGNIKKDGSGNKGAGIPEGFVLRTVEIGISDGTNVEIKSGLNEGDIITYMPVTASQNDFFMMGPGGGAPGGGAPGGGAPGGGANGGTRSGGSNQRGGATGGAR